MRSNGLHINFGKWMQQCAYNPLLQQGHAHINIHLNRETIRQCDKDHFPSLVNCYEALEDHLFDDISKLKKLIEPMEPIGYLFEIKESIAEEEVGESDMGAIRSYT
ncbi:unnamed protein product [Didymodactylos carnosus]|uniref:Uncharacterized protein n=1 Tax=Didymodactylos carnosus TaxID=1234261 RepID=A0A814PUQ4_9BILA|nr:unnamed protein product [Didymodactylos carnosus]CAF1110750.1 unnamed protein product [Didymodactylos carnosus]CAF3510950.1 unnamed protein product [Didymodactylos carnosus]CAF3875182.1 unnamed protein product [Didymodactylos carnosus]